MLSPSIRKFISDESGGYTIWSLIWFSLYVCMGGLAVDFTDAYRNRTQLQATADVAALAGVMSLPDTSEAVSAAIGFAGSNMPVEINGRVVEPDDVFTGNWDTANARFTANGSPLNAVYVAARRADVNQNPLATNFLRILSLWGLPVDRFNINTEAVAIKYVPACLTENGLVALNQVSITSGNAIRGICVHGQNETADPGQDYAVQFNNGNSFQDVEVSMPDLKDMPTRQQMCDHNSGICDPGTLVEGDMWPEDIKHLADILAGLADGTSPYIPGNVFVDADGNPINELTIETGLNENYNGPFEPGHAYNINCSGSNKQFKLPADTELNHVVIVADCQIGAASGGSIKNSVLATSAVGNGSDPLGANVISLPSSWNIGDANFCTDGSGQVSIFAMASVHVAAQQTISGLRAVVGGNFDLTAQSDVAGVSIEAGDSISATANGDFTYCSQAFDGAYAWSYRLVH